MKIPTIPQDRLKTPENREYLVPPGEIIPVIEYSSLRFVTAITYSEFADVMAFYQIQI